MTSTWRPWVMILTVLGCADAIADTLSPLARLLTHASGLGSSLSKADGTPTQCAPLLKGMLSAAGIARGMHDICKCIVVIVLQQQGQVWSLE